MGRIAEALKRAERERRITAGDAREEPFPTAVAPSGYPETIEAPVLPQLEEINHEPVAVVEGLSEALVPYFDRSSLVTEQYRSLRTRLLSQNPNYEHRTIAITSAVPKEGKSVTTLNLGATLAEIRHLRVLVVDGDFRRGSLGNMLNQDNRPGLAEVLTGEATYSESIHDTPIPNLKFVPAGDTDNRSAAELWTSASTRTVFQRMQNDFHYTLVDTPPATTVTDVGIIGQLCTGVVLVVRLHRTDEFVAKRAVRLLQVNNVPLMGCVLVGRDAPAGRYGYGYGYSYSYYNYYGYYNYYNKQSDED
ncbi:MAG: CpsD/CapB family tyrosine-protein kinase [Phycisphaerales bacterium]|nr:MAG: CpsD/CapB family tyrosine-protein kinase [Phycisphaerales bacterium]